MALRRNFAEPPTHDPDGNEITYPADSPTGIPAYYRVRGLKLFYEKDHNDDSDMSCTFQVEILIDETKEKFNSIANGDDEVSDDGILVTTEEYLQQEGAKQYQVDMDSSTPVNKLVEKAYEHLKTLDLFKNAEDC